jgi:hypothetical protein
MTSILNQMPCQRYWSCLSGSPGDNETETRIPLEEMLGNMTPDENKSDGNCDEILDDIERRYDEDERIVVVLWYVVSFIYLSIRPMVLITLR